MSSAGQKRKFMGSEEGGGRESHTQGRLDVTFGQRSVFPGLDDYTLTGDDSLDHDDELGALEYLRSVRQEATKIPTLLVAPKSDRAIYEDGVGDYRGWYSQGAYTAAPVSESEEDESTGREPQAVFYQSLLSKYQALRSRLNQSPPQEALEKLNLELHPTHSKRTKEDEEKWNHRLKGSPPSPVQLALLSKWSVLRLLALLTNQDAVLQRGVEINKNTSLWLWGLLARVPDRGEMTSEQVAIVRELGKKAVLVRLGFNETEDWNAGLDAIEADRLQEEDEEMGYDEEEFDVDALLEAEDALSDEEIPDVNAMLEDQDPVSDEEIPDPELILKDQHGASEDVLNTESSETIVETTDPVSISNPSPPVDLPGPPKSDIVTATDSPTKDPEEVALAAAKARALSSLPEPTAMDDDFNSSDIEFSPPPISKSQLNAGRRTIELMRKNAAANRIASKESYKQISAQLGYSPPPSSEPDSVPNPREIDTSVPSKNTRVALDMILTVAGEVYGQRDLLEFREKWADDIEPLGTY